MYDTDYLLVPETPHSERLWLARMPIVIWISPFDKINSQKVPYTSLRNKFRQPVVTIIVAKHR